MRLLPLALVRDFMAQEGITPSRLCQPAWDALAEGDWQALYRAWAELPPGDRERFELMMRQVHEMATEAGARHMLAEAGHRGRDIAATLDAIDELHAKALWVYTHHRIVFHTASQLLAAASPVGRFWNLTVPSRIVIAVFPELPPYGFGLVRGPIPEVLGILEEVGARERLRCRGAVGG